MKTLAQVKEMRIQRKEFCIKNGLLDLVEKTMSEDDTLKLMNKLGIKTFMCIDSDVKDEFFNLSGLMIFGNHNNDLNKMEFIIS